MIRTIVGEAFTRQKLSGGKVHEILQHGNIFGMRRSTSSYPIASTHSETENQHKNEKLLRRLVTYVEKSTYMEEVRIAQNRVMSIKVGCLLHVLRLEADFVNLFF